jgi:hypothetical protein
LPGGGKEEKQVKSSLQLRQNNNAVSCSSSANKQASRVVRTSRNDQSPHPNADTRQLSLFGFFYVAAWQAETFFQKE